MGTVRSVRLDKAMNMHTSASTWMMTTEERKRYERKVIYMLRLQTTKQVVNRR